MKKRARASTFEGQVLDSFHAEVLKKRDADAAVEHTGWNDESMRTLAEDFITDKGLMEQYRKYLVIRATRECLESGCVANEIEEESSQV